MSDDARLLGFERVLVVDDVAIAGTTFQRVARARWGQSVEVRLATDGASARRALDASPVDLLIIDIRLGQVHAADALPALLHRVPRPLAIATSAQASREEVGTMVVAGASGFVEKTLDDAMLVEIERLAQRPVDFTAAASAWTGRVSLYEVEVAVRSAMIAEALARASGSRRGAARLLGVTREALQHMLRPRTSSDAPHEPATADDDAS